MSYTLLWFQKKYYRHIVKKLCEQSKFNKGSGHSSKSKDLNKYKIWEIENNYRRYGNQQDVNKCQYITLKKMK